MVQEIVINQCFGGFSLSPKAIERYLQLKGKKAYFYKQTKYDYKDKEKEYTKISPDKETFMFHTMTIDLDETTQDLPDKGYFSDRSIPRADKHLVQVIKELKEEANGSYAELEIIKVPDGVKWTIEEYDGNEHIAEKHRTWS